MLTISKLASHAEVTTDAIRHYEREGLKSLRHSQKIFEIIGAVLLILSGIYMLNAYFLFILELAA